MSRVESWEEWLARIRSLTHSQEKEESKQASLKRAPRVRVSKEASQNG